MNGNGGDFRLLGAVNAATEPVVQMLVNDKPFGELTPAEAINLGVRCIQAAIEAERDAALIRGFQHFGMPSERIKAMVAMVREFRQQADPDPRNDVPKGPH